MIFNDNEIKKILLDGAYVDEAVLNKAEKSCKTNGTGLVDHLISEEYLTQDILGQAIAESFGVPYVDLGNTQINEAVIYLVPQLVAESKGVVPFDLTSEGLKVGMQNPNDFEIRHFIEKRAGIKVLPYFITDSSLHRALTLYDAGLKSEIKDILDKLKDPTISREEGDQTTVEVVDKIIDYGYENRASDIHIEPYENKVLVRFRIDGILHDVLDIPHELADVIITRIKIVSKIRTDEHRAAQDGKFRYKPKIQSGESNIDIRVSILPVTKGENVVLRLLSSEGRKFDLNYIGLSKRDSETLMSAIKNTHGIILVTGPTGSGKTTTLYAILKILNKREVHISTIEDPVEYNVEGVSQIQVNPKTNLTFAKGLRAIVRQDPDIIMVGEIRDDETAEIAVNSAMTGHLVLSTLHTNDSATTLPRLIDMKIEPFLVASTVNVIIAQRLVRQICKGCKASTTMSDNEIKLISSDSRLKNIFKDKGNTDLKKITVFHGTGCKVCGNTGYQNRLGIFEVMEMTPEIKLLVQSKASSNDIMNEAIKNGMTTMMEDGIDKVLSGMTTFEEVIRVAYQSN